MSLTLVGEHFCGPRRISSPQITVEEPQSCREDQSTLGNITHLNYDWGRGRLSLQICKNQEIHTSTEGLSLGVHFSSLGEPYTQLGNGVRSLGWATSEG